MTVIDHAQRKLIDRLERSEHDLKERIKELNCLYGISQLGEDRDASIDDILESVVTDLIPPAFQHPDITVARIRFDDKEFVTRGFVDTMWKLQSRVHVAGKPLHVEVFYLQDASFLETFESSLVQDIATRLKVIIENREEVKRQLLDARIKALEDTNQQLHERVMERGTILDVDSVDQQIMHLLSKDGRMKLVDIGTLLSLKDKHGYSHVGVKNRITKLLDNESMRIQATVNLKKFRAVIGLLLLETRTPVDATRVLEAWRACPRVLFSLKVMGGFDVAFGIVAESLEALEQFVDERSPRTTAGVTGSTLLVSTGFHEPDCFPTRFFSTDHDAMTCLAAPGCAGCPAVKGKE